MQQNRGGERAYPQKLNAQGLAHHLLLSGADSEEATMQRSIERLTMEVAEAIRADDAFGLHTDRSISFSEGADIVEVNQVIMLSADAVAGCIYSAAGARVCVRRKERNIVVILDFIGNYKNNFMIPIASVRRSDL